jgi:ribosomal protein L7/L12
MKINISITRVEIKQMIASKLNLAPEEISLTIEESLILPCLTAARTTRVYNKIQAIKDLRDKHREYGLWEAKTVVENIDDAIKQAEFSDGWPVPVQGADYSFHTWK